KLFIKLLRANEWQEVSLKTPLTDLEKKFEKLKGEFDALNELIKSERELYEHSVRDLSNIKNQIEIMKDNILKKVAYYGFETKLDENNIMNYFSDLKLNIRSQIQELESINFSLDIKDIRN